MEPVKSKRGVCVSLLWNHTMTKFSTPTDVCPTMKEDLCRLVFSIHRLAINCPFLDIELCHSSTSLSILSFPDPSRCYGYPLDLSPKYGLDFRIVVSQNATGSTPTYNHTSYNIKICNITNQQFQNMYHFLNKSQHVRTTANNKKRSLEIINARKQTRISDYWLIFWIRTEPLADMDNFFLNNWLVFIN